jgi:very-short-patch-repair endonuclease
VFCGPKRAPGALFGPQIGWAGRAGAFVVTGRLFDIGMDVVLERRLARRATEQLGLITRSQLVGIGFSRGQIARMVDAHRLVKTGDGVYIVGGAPMDPSVELAAACLATGGVASHRSAAHLHGLIDVAPSRPEVTVASSKGHRQGPLVHRSHDLLPRDVVRVQGIRTTTPTRTLIDLGAVASRKTLEAALERGLHERLTTFDRLVRRFFEIARRGRNGVGPLRALLVERDPTLAPAESDLETLLLRILRDAALPEPVRQHVVEIGGSVFRLDVAYPDLMIFMEGDGFGVHTTRQAFERDRDRQNLLVLAGWMPLRFTWRRLCGDPQRVASQVADARMIRRGVIWGPKRVAGALFGPQNG